MQSFEFVGDNLALDFCNTCDRWQERGARLEPVEDFLTSIADLRSWAIRASKTGAFADCEAFNFEAEDLQRSLRLRSTLINIFTSLAMGQPVPTALMAEFNQQLEHLPARVVSQEKDGSLRLKWRSRRSADLFISELLDVSLRLICGGPVDRLKICGAGDCGWVFLDTSRNNSRRWCVMEDCGNREKARRYYARSKT
jgi:predicted RNA-binding Zn ribbon-like protein